MRMVSTKLVWRDSRGVSVIELALLAPLLVLFLSGLVDVSRALAERFVLKQAVNRGLEMVQARPPRIEAGDADYDFSAVRNATATAAGVPPRDVVIRRWLECNGVRQAVTEDCLPEEESARFIELEVRKEYEPYLVRQPISISARSSVRTQ